MQKNSKIPVILGYLYIIIPIIIFFIGWCNIYTAVLGTVIILVSLYYAIKNAPKIWVPENKKQIFLLLVTLLIVLIWVYSSGIGALVFQNTDHYQRNAIFEILVKQPWPVIEQKQSIIMTYYIGFWLPSAVIGKIFNNIQIGYYFQIFWASLGVFLFFYYVLSVLKRKTIFPIILFIFFSGLDAIGNFFINSEDLLYFSFPYFFRHLENWSIFYQYSSNTTLLYWVFNQAIPAWVITMLLLNEKSNKNILFIYSCMFLHATLPAIGVLPIIFYLIIKNGYNKTEKIFNFKQVKSIIFSTITFQNLIGGLSIMMISYLYLSNNISSEKSYMMYPSSKVHLLCYILFILFEVGLYLMFLFKKYKTNILFYIMTFGFLFYPFVIIGESCDFCMRASIPLFVILYFFILKYFDDTSVKMWKTAEYLLIIFFLTGAMTPLHEIYRTVYCTKQGYTKVTPKLEGDNFFGYINNNKFLKYFGKNNN